MLTVVLYCSPKKAKQLLEVCCTSLDDLKSGRFAKHLTAPQNLQIKYHGQVQNASRKEAEDLAVCQLFSYSTFDLTGSVKEFIRSNLPSKFQVILVGG
jgi:hypothetical protein